MQDDMLDRFFRSCRLVKASWDVLRSDQELLIMPILSIGTTILVLFAWAMSARALGFRMPDPQNGKALFAETDPAVYVWIFTAYLLMYFVIFFFNTALVGAALERLEGGNPTLGSAFSLSLQRIGPILGYAALSATVGVLMAAVVERFGALLGRLLGVGFGFVWTVTTFLVVPILAAQGVGPITAVAESASLVRKTWGENLIGNVGISLAMSAIAFTIMVFGGLFGLAAYRQGSPELVVMIVSAAAALIALSAVVGSALQGIYVAAVYRYAVSGEPPWGFDKFALEGAFRKKDSY